MRNFLLLVLLLNILAFIYQRWIIEPDNPVDAMHVEQEVPGLLLAERPAAQPAAPAPAPPSPPTAPVQDSAYRCLRVGPFARSADADEVLARLRRQEAAVRQTEEPGRVWVGHWVQVVAPASRASAEQARDALISAGITDAYIVPAEGAFRISLGVYRQKGSADRTVRQAQSLGFATLVEDRYQAGTNFWLWVRLPGDQTFKAGEFNTGSRQILRTESIDCAEAGI